MVETGGEGTGMGRRRARIDHDHLVERGVHRLYVHVAWTTLQRLPLLGPRSRDSLHFHLTALSRRLGAEPVSIRPFRDRVHVVLRIGAGQDVGRLVTRLKLGSEEALEGEGVPALWGRGFAATTVGPDRLPRLLRRLESTSRAEHRTTDTGDVGRG